ncbi:MULTISPECIES: hypothetical protein [Streptomyces]|uniref:hypothetical protein n=1 Tax=Streptomyces TaxID=1883 RepID=UPI00017F2126|nr:MULTISPECIES: hypothetical protein [Streptomyces]PJN17490.1 hypothetical protein CG724_17965 [Streptomyces sp. CB02120-2]WBY24480.1 hypothetical protein PET44_32910 [Streptomyces goshikiensis]WSY02854.1 hypothetical protein OG590_37185 [Streptomyces goshikiensis]
MGSIHKRIGAVLGSAALFVGVGLTAGAGTASADETGDLASDVDVSVSATGVSGLTAMSADGSLTVSIVSPRDGHEMGFVRWNADPAPAPGIPGDSLIAKDISPDGWAVEAELSNGRIASTRGHKAIYMKVASGNLPEGHKYKLRGCVVKGSERQCTQWRPVHA